MLLDSLEAPQLALLMSTQDLPKSLHLYLSSLEIGKKSRKEQNIVTACLAFISRMFFSVISDIGLDFYFFIFFFNKYKGNQRTD